MTTAASILSIPKNPLVFIRSAQAEFIKNIIEKVPAFATAEFDLGGSNEIGSMQQKIQQMPAEYKQRGLHRPFVALVCDDTGADATAFHQSNTDMFLSMRDREQQSSGYTCLHLNTGDSNKSVNINATRNQINCRQFRNSGQIVYKNDNDGLRHLLERVRTFFTAIAQHMAKFQPK